MEVELEEGAILRMGDPVIVYERGMARRIGNVAQVSRQEPDLNKRVITRWARVELYSSAPVLQEEDFFSYHQTPDSMEWVVQTMLPPRIRDQISALIVEAYRENHEEITRLLRPLIIKSIRDAADVIREEFNKSVARRAEQIQELGDRYRVELVEQELIPLVQDEIWPIVQREGTPLALQIGEELWEQASIWRFGWRMVYTVPFAATESGSKGVQEISG